MKWIFPSADTHGSSSFAGDLRAHAKTFGTNPETISTLANLLHRRGITDHHLPGPNGVPKALAVINPNQQNCAYAYKQLCGAGVAFKLAQGLIQRRLDPKDQSRMLLSFMKIVAIATIADAVALTGENRV